MPDNHKKSSVLSLPQHMRRSALATAISLSLLGQTQAATISVDGVSCTLSKAITTANTGIPIVGCTAGEFGADTLVLQNGSIHTLTVANNTSTGPNGLPLIASDITINGNGSTIERSSVGSTPEFRLFEVSIVSGTLTLNSVTLSNGLVTGSSLDASGGAIFSRGTVTLNDSTISGNSAAMSGGGISNQTGSVILNNSVISDNNSVSASGTSGRGGGLYSVSNGVVILNDSSVINNSASHSGGGIRTGQSNVTLSNSTLSGNSAKYGGGLYDSSAGANLVELTNSTVSGNDASHSGGGFLVFNNKVKLNNATLSGNSAAIRGGNLYARGSSTTVTISNSIIANSLAGNDCFNNSATLTNSGINWFEDNTCNGLAQNDPGLEVLADNGGPTWTHALLPGSGAIDGGDDTVCASSPVNNQDQRSISRLNQGAHCDIGAFELEQSPSATIQIDGVSCTLVNAIISANSNASYGGCTAGGGGTDTLVLQNSSVHSLTVVDNYTYGSNGLPSIVSSILIAGNSSTIQRDSVAEFRLFHVASAGSLTLLDLTLSNGSAISSGGAIFSKGTLNLVNSTVSANTASSRGGGLYSDIGQLQLINTTVSGNSALGSGGGLAIRDSSATLNNSTISSNHANSAGGVYSDESEVTLDNCTVSNNSVTYDGGGLYMTDSIFTLKNSTVSGNLASRGAGVYVYSHYAYSSSTLINSTFSGNSASSYGGAVYVSYGIVTLYNSTVSGNSATTKGAGLYMHNTGDTTASLHNSIVANHLLGGDCFDGSGTLIDNGNNWFEDASCTGSAQGDPGLGGLANNGGPTKTHALTTGSGAIDAGDIAVCADPLTVNNLDQRGETRPDGDQCDIGAFEGSVDETTFMVIPLPGGKTAVIPL